MSATTFESLPNDILIELFEKYINGVDIIIAFASQQNQHIDEILSQCHRHAFDFVNCRKDHFQRCIHRLPTYIKKIERLALSDYNTCGQVSAFLTAHPLLGVLTQLRKLYIHFDALATTWAAIRAALLSTSTTPIHTMTIKVINGDPTNSIAMAILDYPAGQEHQLLTLKHLAFAGELTTDCWEFVQYLAPNVEYLTHMNMSMDHSLGYPMHFVQDYCCLKYLNIRFTLTSRFPSPFASSSVMDRNASFPVLRTLISTFPANYPTTFEIFAAWIMTMPVLRHLHVKAHLPLLNAEKWETLLATSLLSLTYFRLKTTKHRIASNDLNDLLNSFETPFWRALPNFYFIIVDCRHLSCCLSATYESRREEMDDFSHPITQWWVVPFRAYPDPIPMIDATSFCLFEGAMGLSPYYNFNNVQHLVVVNLSDDRLQWLREHVTLSRIECLDLTHLDPQCAIIHLLLASVPQITSLKVHRRQLFEQENSYIGKVLSVEFLTIVDAYTDNDEIKAIAQLFPNIGHLTIKTNTVWSTSLLKTHLPDLRSVTIQSKASRSSLLNACYLNTRIFHSYTQLLQRAVRDDIHSIVLWIDSTVPETVLGQNGDCRPLEVDMDDSGFNDD